MAARKINGAGDHAVTRTKTNFLFCGAAGPLDEPAWEEVAGGWAFAG